MSRVPSFAFTPAVAIWEVTRACALRCRHCRATAVPDRDPAELTTAEGLDLLDQMAELLAPRPGAQPQGVLVLTGGDPLERPDLETLVAAGVRRGLRVALAPSVTPRLTAEAIARLGAAGVQRIALSLDGPDAAVHDGLRGVDGSFARTLDAIAAVRAAGIPLQINTSLDRRTVDALPRTAALVREIAPVLWSVFVVVPVGRAAAALQLDAETCERVFHLLYDWSETTGLAVKTTAAEAYRRVVLQREAERARREPGYRRRPVPPAVNDGKGFLFVSHTGDVSPSGFLPLVAGNVRRERLADVYRWSPLFRRLRDESLLEGKCGRCPFRSVCGGSRARAWATTGKPWAEDPACAYQPPDAAADAAAP